MKPKNIIYLTLFSTLLATQCGNIDIQYKPNKAEASQKQLKSFYHFGDIPIVGADIIQIRTADLDGDGDLDVIVGINKAYSNDAKVILLENKMSQGDK